MPDALVVQAPAAGAQQLVLLFHGVGAEATGLVPLGRLLARAFPEAAVLSVPAPFDSDLGSGRQWFSVRGVTEANRPERIAAVLPRFAQVVHGLQQRFGVAADRTVLVGFSQGAIMALESVRAGQALAARVVSLAGQFAVLPQAAPGATALHFLHGEQDPVVPAVHAVQAAQALRDLGAAVTLDVFPATGHELTAAMAERLQERLLQPAALA